MSSPALIANSDSLREAFGKTLSALGDEFPKLVVLDADMEATPKDEVAAVRPVVTICDGRVTFEA